METPGYKGGEFLHEKPAFAHSFGDHHASSGVIGHGSCDLFDGFIKCQGGFVQHIRSFITAAVAGLAATGAPAQTTPLFDFATAAGMSETYAMLLAGVGALGLMASRCRNAG